MGLVLGNQPGQQQMSGKNPQQQAPQSGKNPQQSQSMSATSPALGQLMQHITNHLQSQVPNTTPAAGGAQHPASGGKNAVTPQQSSPAKPVQAQQPQSGGKNPGK